MTLLDDRPAARLSRRPMSRRRWRRRWRHARRAVRRTWRAHRRALLVSGSVVVLVVLAGAGWIAVRAIQARSHLTAARLAVAQLRDDLVSGRSGAAQLATLQRDTGAAVAETHDPVWWAASWLPPISTVRGLAEGADAVARQVLPPVVQVAPSVAPTRLRVRGNTIALPPLEGAAAPLLKADIAAQHVRVQVTALPSGWVGPVTAARNEFASQVSGLAGSLDSAARFAAIGPAMLGADGPRRYFLAVQNNAEARGTGGLVAGYAIIVADHGRIHVASHGTDADLLNAATPVRNAGAGYTQAYGGYHPTTRWATSNLSPDFPTAAATWAGLWAAQHHQAIDGAIGVDPVALSGLLRVTGPVAVGGTGQVVTGDNVVDLTERREYELFRSIDARKSFLEKVATAVIRKTLSGAGNAQQLASALARSAGTGHLALWSRRPGEQTILSPTPLSGRLPSTSGPFVALVVNNDAGSKLDYYLDRSLTYTAGACTGGVRQSQVVVRLTNNAPRTGLPPYVTIRDDRPGQPPQKISQTRLLVSVYLARGAQLRDASYDGQPADVSSYADHGYAVYLTELTVNPQVTGTLTLDLQEPARSGPVTTKIQPLVRPQHTSLAVSQC